MPQGRRPPASGPGDRVPNPGGRQAFQSPSPLEVALPAGGRLVLNSPDEVVMWEETSRRYIRDYRLTKQNDLIILGALLSQVLVLYRAQRDLSDEKKAAPAQAMITKAADEIRAIEKALGIDKATREKGGQQTVPDYLTRLKRAAHAKGVHISERVKAYEALCMGLRWRIRLYRNGDVEDKQYHDVASPERLLDWAERELAKLEAHDKEWAKEQAAIWVGKL